MVKEQNVGVGAQESCWRHEERVGGDIYVPCRRDGSRRDEMLWGTRAAFLKER